MDLASIGFDEFFQAAFRRFGRPGVPARIAAEHRGAFEVWWTGGSAPARLSGRLRRASEGQPGVGDWVVLQAPPGPGGPAIAEALLPRRSVFTRGAAGRSSRVQVVAANVDVVFTVSGLDADFNPRRIERYVALTWASGAQPVVLLNKADLPGDPTLHVAEIEARCPTVPVHAVSARLGEGLDAPRSHLGDGRTAALVGSSGAGKTTLINALLGEDRLVTRPVRQRDGRGTHTTTTRQLVRLPGEGLLLDTPGMRELLVHENNGVEVVFEDVATLATQCRFRNCQHENEPGCAVQEAIRAGRLTVERLDHFRALEREALAWQRRHDERLHRESERAWGRRIKEAQVRIKVKRGDVDPDRYLK
ncbi:MAG: ribosome small subunit-dependent GTPase A [Deltaproteobacteria bacterium]|nr:ribosome small subunit-dependent GTPase A [Deltaproteobacteria bacterium]